MTSAVPEPPAAPSRRSLALPPFDAVVLAGAHSLRLSGRDKAELVVGGRRLIDRALEAVAGAVRTVIVGPRRAVARPVTWTAECPPNGGPAAALQAGIGWVASEIVVVLAVDLPFVDAPLVSRLVGELARGRGRRRPEGVILRDASGRDQPLAGAYLGHRLRAVLEPDRVLSGVPLRAVVDSLRLERVTEADATHDCDTWADVEAAEAKFDSRR